MNDTVTLSREDLNLIKRALTEAFGEACEQNRDQRLIDLIDSALVVVKELNGN